MSPGLCKETSNQRCKVLCKQPADSKHSRADLLLCEGNHKLSEVRKGFQYGNWLRVRTLKVCRCVLRGSFMRLMQGLLKSMRNDWLA